MKLKKAKFIEIADEITNPERGWYQIHTFKLGEEIDLTDHEYTLNSTDTLALVLIDISAYRDRKLDDVALRGLRRIFDFFRDYRLDMIVRVVYDTIGRCMETEPEEESIVIEHMSQLGPILSEYAGEVFVYQGLLIGNWGEMHSSKFLSPARLKRLSDVILTELEGTAFLAVRRPAYVRILFPEGEDIRQTQVGIFDDAILASDTHMGTFGNLSGKVARRDQSWTPDEELSYVSELCDRVPYGGEALFDENEDPKKKKSLKEIAEYMRLLHISYLNRVHDKRFLDELKQMTWKGKGVFKKMNGYDYIGRHLGYRFVMRNVKCKLLKGAEPTLDWQFDIENVGFARAYFDSTVSLQGKDMDGRPVKMDVSDWMQLKNATPGEITSFHVHTPLLKGKVTLYAAKEATKGTIYFANKVFDKKNQNGELLLGEIR